MKWTEVQVLLKLLKMKDDLKEKVSFDLIRYANCWEDAAILLKGLRPEPGSRILSIAAAGDNSFSLLTTDPEQVLAVDISKPQLFLTALKKEAIRTLDYEDVLSFLGFRESNQRSTIFQRIDKGLPKDVRAYWNQQIHLIEEGIIFQGKFEKYFQLFVKKVLPWIHSKSAVKELLRTKSAEEQELYYTKKWNTWRWRLFFKLFFSKLVMGRFGRDPRFLKEVTVNVGDFIFQRAAQELRSVAAQQNNFLHYNLTASFGDLLPHYLQPENFNKIKANIDRLEIKEGFADEVIAEKGVDYMNLSNIFEYMQAELFRTTARQLVNGLAKNGRMAYWNLMVPRRISALFPDELYFLDKESTALTQMDKGFFYNCFIVDEKK